MDRQMDRKRNCSQVCGIGGRVPTPLQGPGLEISEEDSALCAHLTARQALVGEGCLQQGEATGRTMD